MKNILFICTGNTCRSPMAEALLRAKANGRFAVRSAGVLAAAGYPAAGEASRVLQNQGISLQQHHSKPLDQALVDWADVILTMTQHHKSSVLQQFPESIDKVYMLKEYADDNVDVKRTWQKLEACYAELETERALSHSDNVEALQEEIRILEARLPNYDISDPFGGSVEEYQAVCKEIDQWLDRLIKKEGAED